MLNCCVKAWTIIYIIYIYIYIYISGDLFYVTCIVTKRKKIWLIWFDGNLDTRKQSVNSCRYSSVYCMESTLTNWHRSCTWKKPSSLCIQSTMTSEYRNAVQLKTDAYLTANVFVLSPNECKFAFHPELECAFLIRLLMSSVKSRTFIFVSSNFSHKKSTLPLYNPNLDQ